MTNNQLNAFFTGYLQKSDTDTMQKTANSVDMPIGEFSKIQPWDLYKRLGIADNTGHAPRIEAIIASRREQGQRLNGDTAKAFECTKLANDSTDARKYRDFVDNDGKYNKSKDTDVDNEKAELAAGRKVEKEHTSNPEIATRIAKDHLVESKESPLGYYKGLSMLERFMDKLKQKARPTEAIKEFDEVTKK